jgi:hypothetical protein
VFKNPLEPLRTTVLPSTSLPPWNIKFSLYQFITVIQYLSMAYRSHHCSATLLCSTCTSVFLHTLPCASCSSTFYALCAMSIPCTIPLLCISAAAHCLLLHAWIPLNNNPHLFSIMCIYTICAPSSSSMHSASTCSSMCHGSFPQVVHCHSTFSLLRSLKHQHTLYVLHVHLVLSPLSNHHGNSSAFLAVMPMRSSSLGVMLRFLSLSSSQDSLSSLSYSSSSSLL